jgi:hypothetical protein
MSHGQFLQPDHSRGDANTVGGYRVVHERPAAFEGTDGFSYSVEAMAEERPEDASHPWAGYLLFVRWSRIGASSPAGHLESDYLARAATEAEALEAVGRTPLGVAREQLERLVAARHGGQAPARRWWDAMKVDDAEGGDTRGSDA